MRNRRVVWAKSVLVCVMILASALVMKTGRVAAQSADPSGLPLLSSDGLEYVGGFRLPAEGSNGESFSFGGGAIAFNPAGNSLFVSSYLGAVAEVTIPVPVNSSDVRSLPFATFLQPFGDPTEGHFSDISGIGVNLAGLLVSGNRLIGTASIYYDADNTQRLSHFSRSLQLNHSSFSGWSQVAETGRSGFVSGWMTAVPSEWQALLGGAALTGQCCIPIVWRTSNGPAALAFDPTQIGQHTVNATPLLYYTLDQATLGPWEGSNSTYGATTQMGGFAAIAGTRTVLYFGSNGIGPFCYGNGTADRSLVGTIGRDGARYCYDPTNNSKGNHAYPYNYQVWAYDLNDFAEVKAGTKQPWEVVPYGVWPISFPTPEASFRPGGVGYDAERQLLYVAQKMADPDGYASRPVIHAFRLNATPGTLTSPTTNAVNSVTVTANVSAPVTRVAISSNKDTMVPPAAEIIDGAGAVWVIGSNQRILRNGAHAAHGYGSEILWTSNTLYVLGQDGNWWKWLGTSWTKVGPTQPGGALPPPPFESSPSGTSVPPAAQIIDSGGAAWTLDPNQRVLRDGAHAAGGYASKLLWTSSALYALGQDGNWWGWLGKGWTPAGSIHPGCRLAAPGSSSNVTMVPPAAEIIDAGGAAWTIDSNQRILCNGAHAAYGYGSKILWTSNTLYVLGRDGNWWRWLGTGWTNAGSIQPGGQLAPPGSSSSGTILPPAATIINVGPTQPSSALPPPPFESSPSGTSVPPAAQIIDSGGAAWTLDPNQRVLRDGAHAAGGYGSKILWTNNTLYVLGRDGNWWRWLGTGWTNAGSIQPGVQLAPPGSSSNGTMVPSAAKIIDAGGAAWTIDSNQRILCNGAHAAYGYGSKILWTSNTLYVLGRDGNWWRWLGANWAKAGPTQPS